MLFMGSACGSGVKYKVEDATVADLPLSEKGELLMWQADRDRARDEKDKARADVRTAEHAIVTAQDERGQARLASRKIASDIDLATPRRDVPLLIQLQVELAIAKLAENAAETRVRWCKQQRVVSQAQLAAATTRTSLTEARIEQARAHLAARHGRLPSGDFQVDNFDQQVAWSERNNNEQQQNVMAQITQSAALELKYTQQLRLYGQMRSQTPDFTSSYTPPGYSPPLPQTDAAYVPGL
jgi:hypothetical protein